MRQRAPANGNYFMMIDDSVVDTAGEARLRLPRLVPGSSTRAGASVVAVVALIADSVQPCRH
jgi:hypothetical protein